MTEWPKQFFNDLYGRVLSAQFTKEQSEAQARTVARLLQLRKGMRVLDIPCGLGRLTLPLAQRGLKMTGVDVTEPYIKKAARLARQNGLDVSFMAQDMRRINFRQEFDAAFNWFTSFGYYSRGQNLLCLRRLHAALRPGGRLLIETMNPSWLNAHFRRRGEQKLGGVRIVQVRYRTRQSRLQRTAWTFHYGRRELRSVSGIMLYNATEMRQLLHQAGFEEIRICGHNRITELPSRSFTRHSKRMIALARKPVE